MIVYHLCEAKWALDNLENGRLKVSQIEDLNDPFELSGPYLKTKEERKQFRSWRTNMAKEFGMLCFSRDWSNPVLWSHYAKKHTGIAIGFEIPSKMLMDVIYSATRLPPESIQQAYRTQEEGEAYVKTLLLMKYNDWSYEDEVRVFTEIKEPDPSTGLHFVNFGDNLKVKEVIAGPLCTIDEATIRSTLSKYQQEISVVKARLAFKSFRIVKNKKGFNV